MPIDTSIYNNNPLRTAQQYSNDIMQGQMNRQAMQQNALALETGRAGLAEKQRAAQEQEAIRSTVSGLGPNAAPDAQINALRGLGTPAAYAQAESLQKQMLERQKQAADVGKTEAETKAKQLETTYKALEYGLQSLQAAQTPEQAAQMINGGVTGGHWSMQDAQGLLQSMPRDPAQFPAWREEQLKRVTPAKDAIEAQYKRLALEEAKRGRNQADATTRRGQDMTDARGRDIAALQREDLTQRRAEAGATKQAADLDKAVTDFSKTLQREGVPELETAVSGAEAALGKYKTGEVPGIGAAKNALPAFMMSDEGKAVRQALAEVRNIVLSARSGAAVTDQELRRLVEEIGTGVGMSEADLRRGLSKVRERIESIKTNAAAGVNDDVLSEYTKRGGLSIKRAASATPGPLGSGADLGGGFRVK